MSKTVQQLAMDYVTALHDQPFISTYEQRLEEIRNALFLTAAALADEISTLRAENEAARAANLHCVEYFNELMADYVELRDRATGKSKMAETENLLEQYWELAYAEGATNTSNPDEANRVLSAIRDVMNSVIVPSDEDILVAAEKLSWRFKRSSDPHHSDTFTFNRKSVLDFAKAILKSEK